MKSIVIQREARVELDEAISRYEERQSGLEFGFHTEVEATIALIQDNPFIGAAYKKTEFRHLTLRRFPYVIYYGLLEEAIWIIAITHGKRRLGYWRNRRLG